MSYILHDMVDDETEYFLGQIVNVRHDAILNPVLPITNPYQDARGIFAIYQAVGSVGPGRSLQSRAAHTIAQRPRRPLLQGFLHLLVHCGKRLVKAGLRKLAEIIACGYL